MFIARLQRYDFCKGAAVCAAVLLFGQPVVAQLEPGDGIDGKSLYMATFQGRGPALFLVPEIQQNFDVEEIVPVTELPKVLSILDEIIVRIQDQEPRFFDRFHTALRSGDHLTVESEIHHAAELTRAVILDMPAFKGAQELFESYRGTLERTAEELGPDGPRTLAEVDQYLARIRAEGPQGGEDPPATDHEELALALAVAGAVAVVYPPAVAIAVAVAVAWYWYWQQHSATYIIGDRLLQEEIIDSLVANVP